MTIYTPTKAWIQNNRLGKKQKFDGKVDVFPLDLNSMNILSINPTMELKAGGKINSLKPTPAKTADAQYVCSSVNVWADVPYQCASALAHWPWEACDVIDPERQAGYRWEYQTQTTCSWIQTDPPPPGNTTPTPPPGYDPCDTGLPPGTELPVSTIDDTPCDSSEQNIDLLPYDRLKYPTLAKIADGLYDKVKNDQKLMSAVKNFSHLTEQQILSNLEPGKGPKLTVLDMPNKAGHYDPKTNTIQIAKHVVTATNYKVTSYATALELYIAVSILHEFIHFGENFTQIFLPYDNPYNDAGFQFENDYYGGRVFFNYVTGEITYER